MIQLLVLIFEVLQGRDPEGRFVSSVVGVLWGLDVMIGPALFWASSVEPAGAGRGCASRPGVLLVR